jgi:hypothetical protein
MKLADAIADDSVDGLFGEGATIEKMDSDKAYVRECIHCIVVRVCACIVVLVVQVCAYVCVCACVCFAVISVVQRAQISLSTMFCLFFVPCRPPAHMISRSRLVCISFFVGS